MNQAGAKSAGMQRVRIGLTGLAFVFLAVLLAAILTGRRQDEVPAAGITASSSALPADANSAEQPSEPLAELGVAPGAAEEANTANAATPR